MVDRLVIFRKALVAGSVKTRLARVRTHVVGDIALVLYRAMLTDLERNLKSVRKIAVVYADSVAVGGSGFWSHARVQRGADLGERMRHAFEESFAEGVDRTLVIGTDVPQLTGRRLEAFFEMLRSHDLVVGPAGDGGYYLIGFTKAAFRPEIFDGIPWSSDGVLAETVARAGRLDLRLWVGERLTDIDTPADLVEVLSDPSARELLPDLARAVRSLEVNRAKVQS